MGASAVPWGRQSWLELAPAFEFWLSRGALRIVVRKGAVVAERRGALECLLFNTFRRVL